MFQPHLGALEFSQIVASFSFMRRTEVRGDLYYYIDDVTLLIQSCKIDHSTSGINSKDSADGICGAVWNAAQHAEELSIDFTEDIENTLAIKI